MKKTEDSVEIQKNRIGEIGVVTTIGNFFSIATTNWTVSNPTPIVDTWTQRLARRERKGRIMVPELKHGCNSWIATRKGTGEVIGEFFIRANVEEFDPATVLVETTADYLARYNTEVRRAYA